MIPTLILVHDDNEELATLGSKLSPLLRVVHRTSFEGERLYGTPFFEGALLYGFDERRHMIRKDVYDTVFKSVIDYLSAEKQNPTGRHKEIEKYQLLRKADLPSLLGIFNDAERELLEEYLGYKLVEEQGELDQFNGF